MLMCFTYLFIVNCILVFELKLIIVQESKYLLKNSINYFTKVSEIVIIFV